MIYKIPPHFEKSNSEPLNNRVFSEAAKEIAAGNDPACAQAKVVIIVDDCRNAIRSLQEPLKGFFTSIITSPPYFGLRNNGCGTRQIGLGSFAEYQAAILEICSGLRTLAKKEALFWLQIGDKWAGGGNGRPGKNAQVAKATTSRDVAGQFEVLPRGYQNWECLVRALLEFRINQTDPLRITWCAEAERIFRDFDQETANILASWPEEAAQHSGRSMEMAVRLAGVLLAVDNIFGGKNPHSEKMQAKTAAQAVELMQWFFRHRLRIQKDAYRRYLAVLAEDLDAKLKKMRSVIRVSRIKDSHPHLSGTQLHPGSLSRALQQGRGAQRQNRPDRRNCHPQKTITLINLNSKFHKYTH